MSCRRRNGQLNGNGIGVELEAANGGIEHPNEVDRLGQIVLDAESLVSCFLQHMRTP